jgi:predicted alpha/beta superfamily hydrolase
MKSKIQLFICLFILLIIQTNSLFSQVTKGEIIEIKNFQSKYVDSRTVSIWLPEGYDSLKRYPVLYMNDGQMLFDSTITWNKQEWKVDETASNLISTNKIKPFIVVGIWNNRDKRRFEYMPQKPFEKLSKTTQVEIRKQLMDKKDVEPYTMLADNYLKFIVKELKPYIDSHFSSLPNQENTFIAGSSFGGMISWYAICEYPKIFGGAICISTHWPGMFPGSFNPQLPEAFFAYLNKKLPSPNNHKIYFDYGTETLDVYYEPYQLKVDKIMESKGYKDGDWMSLKFPGEDHSEKAWAKRMDYPLQFIFGKKN